eukprot:6169328-Prymnesium_polylepis.1
MPEAEQHMNMHMIERDDGGRAARPQAPEGAAGCPRSGSSLGARAGAQRGLGTAPLSLPC